MKILFVIFITLTFSTLLSQPKPGDVFREYMWYNSTGDGGGSLRVGGNLDYGGGWLSHATNLDLVDAIKAEIVIEKLESHTGTHGLKINMNDKGWITFPEADKIPFHQKNYHHHTYPVVSIPLTSLNQGTDNKFRLQITAVRDHWDQNLIYGVHIRVYYNPSLKAHPTGQITSPLAGEKLGDLVTLQSSVTPNGSNIQKVQYIGKYEDVNYEGDGVYRQWHYHYFKGNLMHNLGNSSSSPFSANWATTWIPDQLYSFEVAARIIDQTGMIYFTEPVSNLQLDRPNNSIVLIKPYDVPRQWVTRASRRQEKIFIRSDLERVTAAQMLWTSWGPGHSEGIMINEKFVFHKEGQAHRYTFHRKNITPLSVFEENENIVMTEASASGHHGMEVQWPGIMFLLNTDFSSLPKTAPSSPDSLIAELVETGLKINWKDNANNERGFIIERRIDGGSYSVIGKTNWVQRTSFIDSTFDEAIHYAYRVLAFNDYGTSASEEITLATPSHTTFLNFKESSQYLPKVNWLEFAGFYYLEDYKGLGGESGVLKTVPNRPNTSSYIGKSFSFSESNSITQRINLRTTSIKTKGIEAFKFGLISVGGDELDLESSDSSFVAFVLKVSKNENTWRMYSYNKTSSTNYEILDSTSNTIEPKGWYNLNIVWNKSEDNSISYEVTLGHNDLQLSGSVANTSLFSDDSIYVAVEANDKGGVDAIDNFFIYSQTEPLTDIEDELFGRGIPENFNLSQNYPNPFNPETTIKYSLPSSGFVKLDIFNILGQKVKTLINGIKSAGTYNVNWNASSLPSGVYFYSLNFNNNQQAVKKMLLLK